MRSREDLLNTGFKYFTAINYFTNFRNCSDYRIFYQYGPIGIICN